MRSEPVRPVEAICFLLLQPGALDDDGDKDDNGDGFNYAYGNGCALSKLSNYLFNSLLMTTNIVTYISENFDGQNDGDNEDNDLVILNITMSC